MRKKLYGRTRLRGLGPQAKIFFDEMYPRFKVSDQDLLNNNLSLEVGCGYGEHIIHQALQNPTKHYIGCEPFLNGMISILKQIQKHNLSNISLYYGDANDILEKLNTQSLEHIFIFFPDPWPKTKHAKRRFIQTKRLEIMHHVLRPNGKILMGTDHKIYKEWINDIFSNQDFFDKKPFCHEMIKTKYQEWSESEGRSAQFFCFEKIKI